MFSVLDPKRRPDPVRSRRAGLAIVGLAGVIALVVTFGAFLPALDALTAGLGASASRATPVPLPATILVCDREYALGSQAPTILGAVRASSGVEPIVVPRVPGCPTGICLEGGLCQTVLFVLADGDRYATYELQGGP